ncbi:hypothetical protein FRC02_009978 [Tulasnella sp. 418]|nr:hypothetical protein FRC02_009978 [Tulasnella sp. 418]
MASNFVPTPASIPPQNATYRMTLSKDLPVHITPLNPISFILRAAHIYPKNIAIVHPDGPGGPVYYTFEVWAQRVQNLAYALIRYGIRPGDRVAVIAPNCPLIAGTYESQEPYH